MDLQLKGKTALVTGASMGIGRAIAKGLAAEGVKLCIAARRKPCSRSWRRRSSQRAASRPDIVEIDMMEQGAPEKLARAAQQALGSVDILVNSAGGSKPALPIDAPEALWEESMTLNFIAHAPAHPRPAAGHDREELGARHQHQRQVRAGAHDRRAPGQGRDPRLVQRTVARGRQARHHGELHPARAHHERADPPQVLRRSSARSSRRRKFRSGATASRRNWRPSRCSSPPRSPATSPARCCRWMAASGATLSENA